MVIFLFYPAVVRQDSWYNFSFLNNTQTCFVELHMIYCWECSLGTWKNMYCVLFEWNIFCVSNKSTWSNALFKAHISLLIFCLDHLSNDVSELLISCTFILLLFISPFIPINFCFTCLGGTCTGWIDSYKFENKSWIHKKSIDIQISILCTFFFFGREVIMQHIHLIKCLHAEYGKNNKITTKWI